MRNPGSIEALPPQINPAADPDRPLTGGPATDARTDAYLGFVQQVAAWRMVSLSLVVTQSDCLGTLITVTGSMALYGIRSR